MPTFTATELLAPETLSLVFILGAARKPDDVDSLQDATKVPVTVSHVCRRWRCIALSTPRLWNTIIIGPFRSITSHCSETQTSYAGGLEKQAPLHRIRAFLERSNRSPLMLYVDIRSPTWYFRPIEGDHPFTTYHMSALLEQLLPHLERWEEVKVISEAWETFRHFLECTSTYKISGMQPQAKLLRRLSLIRSNAYIALDGTRISPETSYKTPFKNAPALRIVELDGVHVDWTSLCSHNLTELSLRYHARDVLPSALEFVTILKSSPNIESLTIHGWGIRSFEDDLSGTQGRVSLANIKRFSVGWVDARYFNRLFSLFIWRLTKLESLALEDVLNSLDPLSAQDSSDLLNYVAKRISEDNGRFGSLSRPLDLVLNSVRSSTDSLRHIMETLPPLCGLTLHNVNETLLNILDPLRDRTNYKSPPWTDLMRIVIRTAGDTSITHAREFMNSIALSSPRHLTLQVEDLLEPNICNGFFDEIDEDRDIKSLEAPNDSPPDDYRSINAEDEEDDIVVPIPYTLPVYNQFESVRSVGDDTICQPIDLSKTYSMRSDNEGSKTPL